MRAFEPVFSWPGVYIAKSAKAARYTSLMKPKKAWLEASYRAATLRVSERPYPFRTLSNLPVEPVYTHEDLTGFDPEEKLGYPGDYPYTRGVQASMYRSKLWTMRQFCRLRLRRADERAV